MCLPDLLKVTGALNYFLHLLLTSGTINIDVQFLSYWYYYNEKGTPQWTSHAFPGLLITKALRLHIQWAHSFHLGRFWVLVLVLPITWKFKLWMRGNLEYHDGNKNILINHLIILKFSMDENTYVDTHREIVHQCEDRFSATCVWTSVYSHLTCREI